MSDETPMSVSAAAQQAKQHPHDASEAIQILFDYVEDDGNEASNAVTSLAAIARRAPDAFDGQTAHFVRAIETTHDYHSRLKLVKTVNQLIEQEAIPSEDAGRGLTEAINVTPEQQYWEERPEGGLQIIQDVLKGWADVAARDEPVPEIIVNQAIELIKLEEAITLIYVIDVLQAAIESGSPATDTAFQNLVEIAQGDDPGHVSEATLAIAKLVLSGDVPDQDTAQDVITANAEAVRRDTEIVEQALEKISS